MAYHYEGHDILPDRPSALIRLALVDLRSVEEDPDYRVNMSHWHTPSEGACYVCLAGAIMTKSLDAPRGEYVRCGDYPGSLGRKLAALDELRRGQTYAGLMLISLPPSTVPRRHIPSYHDHRDAFFAAMEALADELEKEEL